MKGKHIFWPVVLVGIIVHGLFFANGLEREYVVERHWAKDLVQEAERISIGTVPSNGLAFSHGAYYGYINSAGKILHLAKSEHEVALNTSLYVLQSQESDVYYISQWGRGRLGTAPEAGYPVFINDSLYILGAYAQNISKIEHDATTLWQLRFTSPVTNVVANAAHTLVATLPGNVFDENGRLLLESNGYPVYSLAVSQSHLLVLHGGVPQQARLYTLDLDKSETEDAGTEYLQLENTFVLETPVLQNMPAAFSDSGTAVFAGANELIMLGEEGSNSVKTRRILALRSGDAIFAIEEDNLAHRYFSAWDYTLEPLFSVLIPSDCDFLIIQDEVYLAADGRVLSLSISLYE